VRRTFAKLAKKGRTPLEQIQTALGHASIRTAERYLGFKPHLKDGRALQLPRHPRPRWHAGDPQPIHLYRKICPGIAPAAAHWPNII
jgi:hypothetical protein